MEALRCFPPFHAVFDGGSYGHQGFAGKRAGMAKSLRWMRIRKGVRAAI